MSIVINLNTTESGPYVYGTLDFRTNDRRDCLMKLGRVIEAYANGSMSPGTLLYKTGTAYATATLTLTGLPADMGTFVIGGVTITGVTGTPAGAQFKIETSATVTAANIVTLMTTLKGTTAALKCITTTSLAGVVTFTCDIAGDIGNSIVLTENLTNATCVSFTGGTEANSFSI